MIMGFGHRFSCCSVLIVLFILCTSMRPCFCRNSTLFCREEERLALLEFKQSLRFEPPGLLQSWEMEDCCKWKGVACDPKTGHVTKLELFPSPFPAKLTDQYPGNPFSPYELSLLYPNKPFSSYELSPSISKLRYLTHLDLSGLRVTNNTLIPQFIGSMKQLRYLNLSSVGFTGIIPTYFGNLTHLEVLDLGQSEYYYYFYGYYDPMLLKDPRWISGLRSLKYIDMSGVQLGEAHDLIELLGELPSLTHLVLSHSGINNSHLSLAGGLQNHSSFANLQYLDLSGNKFQGQIPSNVLQNIPSLIYLDLSQNHFDSFESPFPLSPNLQHLDISVNRFQGQIPGAIKNMSSLIYLGLSGNHFDSFESPFPLSPNLRHLDISNNQFQGQIQGALQNMTSLTYLDLSSNHFTSIPMCTDLESIVHLDLGYNSLNYIEGGFFTLLRRKCNLRFLNLDDNFLRGEMGNGNSTGFCAFNLEALDANFNDLVGELPDWLWNLTNLRYLLLSDNRLQGAIPESLGQLRSLQWLHLGGNLLSGQIPHSLGQLSELQQLSLAGNSLGGIVSEVHLYNLSKLKALDLADNNLVVRIKNDWVPPFQLREILMRSCRFDGRFPLWEQIQRSAYTIDLSNASISGDMPSWLGAEVEYELYLNLSHNHITGPIPKFPSSLRDLDLSHNQIIGPIPTLSSSLLSLDLLFSLDLSHNLISGPMPPNMGVKMPKVSSLFLNDNLLTGPIPASLCALESLTQIDLSNNRLSGPIPDCWGNSTNINFINWSSNNISGEVPGSISNLGSLTSLHLSNNSLQGKFPTALRSLTNLLVLDLGENNFSGILPTWIGESFLKLKILRLRHNRFSGRIPLQLCLLSELHILDLSANNLVGLIPPCLSYITGMIQVFVSSEKDGPCPSVAAGRVSSAPADPFSASPSPVGLGLFSTMDWSKERMLEAFKGRELEYTTNLVYVISLDLSSNNLIGMIPEELTRLNGLLSLNLSHNVLSGNIPDKIGDMAQLESLDVSNNLLSGTIPQGISALTFLSHLNLSNNNFTGRIPKGNQLISIYQYDHSIYAGNPLLCGDPLQRRCPGDKEAETPRNSTGEEEGDESDSSSKMILCGVIALGFATGFWAVIGALVFRKDWRAAYFTFAEEIIDKVYVAVTVKVAKIKRRMNGCFSSSGSVQL